MTWQHGINDAGGEFGGPFSGGDPLPGTFGADYQYDSSASLAYLRSRGHTIVRLPFLWERIQPTLGAALNTTELARLQAYVTRAGAAGLRVVLDVHNYGTFSPPPGSTTYFLGDGNLTQSHFSDLWQRLSAAFAGNSVIIGYGLMNEPHSILPIPGTFSGTVRYNWNDGLVDGWVGDSATASNVSNKLRLTGTVPGGGYWEMRKDDNGTVSGGTTPTGNVLEVTATLGVGSPAGTWLVRMEWQTNAPTYQWQRNATTEYVRLDTNQAVAALVPGVACSVRSILPSSITNPNGFAIHVESSNAVAGTVTIDFDDYRQGALTGHSSSTQVWEQTSQGCVTAIRGNGDTTTVMVSTYPSAEPDAAAHHPTAWITDSAGPGLVRYEAHIYFDDDISGNYSDSFAAETTLAAGQGYLSVQERALARLDGFATWLSDNGVLGYMGEVGWPHGTDATSWNEVGAAFYAALASRNIWVTYWSTGELWGSDLAQSWMPMVAYMQAGSRGSGLPLSIANAQAPIIEATYGSGSFTQVTVARDYDLATGAAPSGVVYFTPSAWLVNGATVPSVAVTAPLDVNGKIAVTLFANTDPATTPTGSYYTVREVITGQPTRSYRMIVPHSHGSPLDLAALAAAYPSIFSGGTGYGSSAYGTSGYGD